jgi:porphobilinogen deaminase
MKSNRRCPACERSRKPGHEKRCGTPKAYHKDCKKYENFDMKVWLTEVEAKKQEKIAALKAKEKAKQDAANVVSESQAIPVIEEIKVNENA